MAVGPEIFNPAFLAVFLSSAPQGSAPGRGRQYSARRVYERIRSRPSSARSQAPAPSQTTTSSIGGHQTADHSGNP